MPERPEFWGLPTWAPPVLYTVLALSSLFMLVRLALEARAWWKVGRPLARWDQPLRRLGLLLRYYFGQGKVLLQPYPGVMHLAIFSSMVVFLIGTALATVNSHFATILTGGVYLVYKLALDLFILVFFIGAGMAAYRRYLKKPERLTRSSRFGVTLGLLSAIVLLGWVIESFRLAIDPPAWAAWSPLGWALAQIWIATGMSAAALNSGHLVAYALHIAAIVVLFVTVPTSTLLHVVTTAFNIFFAKLDRPTGQLAPVPTNAQGEYIYTDRVQHLTWKQLLEGDTCTECGRCQDVCPAYAAGRPLNPKKLILGIREAFHAEQTNILKDQPETKPLVGSYIPDEMLWCCTTCGACVRECPVMIEHLDAIVDMRRYLVSESRVDDMLQEVLANLGRYGNSFGQSERARSKWTLPVQPKLKDARKEEVDVLWFVGDYASFNPTVTDATRLTAEVFQKASLDFGILYEGERNAGNDVRRVGEEGLFEILVEKNSAVLSKAQFKSIVTTDPHTLNALKNEYPKDVLNGRPVLHYSELLWQLISHGQLKLSKKLGYRVTYHDPCYLGRYNGVFDAPRQIILAAGCELVEMPRCRARSLCCNAGGGQIWMKEGEMRERPSESRIREAAALDGVGIFVVACPKDLTMYRDAVKTTQMESRMAVKDLIELVYEAL
jgi:Fe-S oxidoreductase/nitrate reductase gamma subunit